MATRTKMYRLPAPELPDSAKGPENFEALARAVEGQAFPALNNWSNAWGDVNRWVNWEAATRATTVYSISPPSSGVIGWIDVDANVWAGVPYPNEGVAGNLAIKVNGVEVRSVRWHNWWRTHLVCAYCSIRWPNPSGLPAKVDIVWNMDNYQGSQGVYLLNFDMSYQIYGKKVS
jgi:hypothetical protein